MLLLVLAYIAWADVKSFRIPNYSIICLITIALYIQINTPWLINGSLVFLFGGGLSIIGVQWVKKEFIGMGDIKLIASFCLFLSGIHVLFIVWLSALLGLIGAKVFRFHQEKIPFGLYLSIGFTLVYFNIFSFEHMLGL